LKKGEDDLSLKNLPKIEKLKVHECEKQKA
jgi:hypothetical protein